MHNRLQPVLVVMALAALGLVSLTAWSAPVHATVDDGARGNASAPTTVPLIVTPTPTGEPCAITSTGHSTSCGPANSYSYSFGVQTACTTILHSNGGIYFDIGPTASGPWTQQDYRYVQQDFPPGVSSVSGVFNEPDGSGWYRLREDIVFNNNGRLLDQTDPAPLCPLPSPTRGTPSATATPTGSPIHTGTPGPPTLTRTPTLTPLATNTYTVTATPTACALQSVNSYANCAGPNDYTYSFSYYNTCPTTFTSSGTVILEVSAAFNGPWTIYDQQTVTPTFAPGTTLVNGTFTIPNLPAGYNYFRATLNVTVSNGQTLARSTGPRTVCNVPVTPTTTGISRCFLTNTGAQADCQAPSTYNYDFGFFLGCSGGYINGTVTVSLEVAPDLAGPWTVHDTQTFNHAFPPDASSVGGSWQETGIPVQNRWYRFKIHVAYILGRTIDNVTNPSLLCTPPTPTATMTASLPTHTPIPPTATLPPPTDTPPPASATLPPLATGTQPPASPTPPPLATGTLPAASATPPGATATPTGTPTALPPCEIFFSDVDAASPFYPYIRCLACRGILSGYGDGTFRPDNLVTRGQATKLVANAAAINAPVPSAQQTFEDVPPSNPFWVYIERLATAGTISGYACGGVNEYCQPPYNRPWFRPYTRIIRGQLAKINALTALYNDVIPSGQQTFEDVAGTNVFWVYIERVNLHGIISGYGCGGPGEPCNPPTNRPYFRPSAPTTRGQTAKIVANTFYPGCQTP